MAYVTISHWTATEWNDEMEAQATSKFVPMIMSVGATGVQMIRTGDLAMCVVTQYPMRPQANPRSKKSQIFAPKRPVNFP